MTVFEEVEQLEKEMQEIENQIHELVQIGEQSS
jgi:uncharacterized protein (UPF0335 family)